jgi:hypothetical protein
VLEYGIYSVLVLEYGIYSVLVIGVGVRNLFRFGDRCWSMEFIQFSPAPLPLLPILLASQPGEDLIPRRFPNLQVEAKLLQSLKFHR